MKQSENKNIFGGSLTSLQNNTSTSGQKDLQLGTSSYAIETFIKKYGLNPLSVTPFCQSYDDTNIVDFNNMMSPSGLTCNLTFFGTVHVTAIPLVNGTDGSSRSYIDTSPSVTNFIAGFYIAGSSHFMVYEKNRPFNSTQTRVENMFVHHISNVVGSAQAQFTFQGFLISH